MSRDPRSSNAVLGENTPSSSASEAASSGLRGALTLTPLEGDDQGDGDGSRRYRLSVEDGWQQGRGAFGGLVLGALAQAIMASEPDPARRLRAFTGQLPGPVPVGDSLLRVAAVRQGSGASTWQAWLDHEGETLAVATAVLGRARAGEAAADMAKVESPPWTEVAVAPVGPPIAPRFLQHFELRPTGPLPFSGGEPRCAGFVRERGAPSRTRSAADVIALSDVYWPTFLVRQSAPRVLATVSFSLQLMAAPEELEATAPLFHQARELGRFGGFVAEQRDLFTPEGALVAVSQQTFAIVK